MYRDIVSCFKKYDVTNNEVPNADAHGGSEFTTDDSNFLLLYEGLKVDKRFVLEIIGRWGYTNDCESCDDDSNTLKEASPSVGNTTENARENGRADNDPPNLVICGSLDGFKECRWFWNRFSIDSKSIKIGWLVLNKAKS